MAERLVVLVENDPVLSERVRAVLSAHSFKVEVIADGNELLSSPNLAPALIILCIDPKRLGWAICNKIKKTVQYRDVPTIVTSQEATDKDFEDHKKLRTRADEYLHKPYSVEVLLSKVDQAIGLKPPADSDEGAVSLDDAAIEEISVDEAVIEEEIQTPEVSAAVHKRVDHQIEEETDAAFAAIGGGSSAPKSPVVEPAPSRRSPPRVQASMERPQKMSPMPSPVTEPTLQLPRRGEQDRPASSQRAESGPVSAPIDHSQTAIISRTDDPNATLRPGQSARTPKGGETRASGPDLKALEQALAEAQKRLEKADAQATFWHDQRDQLASDRDQLSAERDQLAAERNQLAMENSQLATERDTLRSSVERAGPSPELLAAQARLSSERDQLAAERNRLGRERDELLSQRDNLVAERDQLAHARHDLAARIEQLSVERDELLAGHDRLSADFSQLHARVVQAEESSANATPPSISVVDQTELLELRRDRDLLISELQQKREAASTWQTERARLQSEIDELKSRPAVAAPTAQPPTSGMLRDREVISLKEVINRKEKEILDLRDTLDAKDRQMLDARDKAREAERARRELDERLLGFEREHLGLHEKLEAQNADREVWQEREKGLKGRLEDAQRKLQRADEDLQAARRKLESELGRLDGQFAEERRRFEEAIAAAQRQQQEALQRLSSERDTREAALLAAHQDALVRERAAGDEERRALEQRQAQAWSEFEAQYQTRFEERVRRHEETLASVQRTHEGQQQELQAQHQRELSDALAQLEHATAVLGDLREQHPRDLELLRSQLTAELTAHHEGVLSRTVRESEERVRAAANVEKDVLRGERIMAEKRGNELETQLVDLQRRHQSAEANVSSLQTRAEESEADGRRLRVQLGERDQQVADLRNETAALQEQIQRAYQRLVSDENQMTRVRRALNIALSVLDEGQAPNAEGGGEAHRDA